MDTVENSRAELAARWAALEGQDLFADDDLGSDDDGVTETQTAAPLAPATASAPVVLPVWELLSEEQAQAQLADLWPWILWVADRHELRDKIRPCWAEHGPAVEAFTALWGRYLAIYHPPVWGGAAGVRSNHGGDALIWIEQLHNVVERLERTTLARCAGGHTPVAPVEPEEAWFNVAQHFGKLARSAAVPMAS